MISTQQPLAFRMRPTRIEDIIGQQHLIGENQILHRMVQAKRFTSMILYGPPGTGKTSLASAIAGSASLPFRTLNAATDTKKDLLIVAEEAKMSGSIVLLLDEIHRLDKVKQDFLLPHLEQGRIILIGATTENPYISIHPAIRSRSQIFELLPLTEQDMALGIERALNDSNHGLGEYTIALEEQAYRHFATSTNGDLRSALNALELAVLSTPAQPDGTIHITLPIAEQCLQKKALTHDKDGDAHYDVISAFQKSIRGGDVDAALHYAARLIEAGELSILCRRLLVIAYEDISFGNAPAVERTVLAVQAAERLGFPEARIPLSHAIIELTLSPKSNTAIVSIDAALADVRIGRGGAVPAHLRDAHYKGAHQLGRGIEYLYPHDYPDHWVKQDYLPDPIRHKRYFTATSTSKYEQALLQQYRRYDNKK